MGLNNIMPIKEPIMSINLYIAKYTFFLTELAIKFLPKFFLRLNATQNNIYIILLILLVIKKNIIFKKILIFVLKKRTNVK